jgi:sugar phosphate permease
MWAMTVDEDTLPISRILLLQILFFAIGAVSFPPHSLIGLFSREIVPVNMQSTAGCVAKATGQLGAAVAGLPLQQLAAVYGWGCVGHVIAVCGVVAGMIFMPLWNRTPDVLDLPAKQAKQA